MAYYIIDKITNKINPNLITGEVALFETEEEFLIAKQQWINDNTVINKDNYQYRVATEIEKNQHFDDYLKYKIDNATETSIVITHKENQNIENTSRQPMIDYIIDQHRQEVFGDDHNYIKATGDLLNEFLTTKELIENEKKSKEIFENKKNALYQQITKDMDSQRIQYNFYNSQKPITESRPKQIVAYYGLPILETYNQLQVKISSNDDPVKIETIDLKAVFEVPFSLLKYVDEVISKNNNNKNNTKFALQSALSYNCDTEEQFTNIKDYYEQSSVQDGDDVKDGFQTVPVDIAKYNIKIYDLTMGLEVLQNTKTKEETDITNIIFKKLI